MSGDYLKIGSLLGLAALKKSSDSTFLAFGSDLKYPKVDVNDTVMTNMDRCKDVFGGGTNTGMCIDYLLGRLKDSVNDWNGGGYHKQFPVSEKTTAPVNVDNIIIFTDEQQNAGSPVVKLFREYRMKVNKNAKLFIVDVAPYQARLANQDEPGVTFIYGWNDTVLDVLGYAMRGSGSHVEQIKKMK
jgi:60 kDa SS-A/Ro ribonucleoprotein